MTEPTLLEVAAAAAQALHTNFKSKSNEFRIDSPETIKIAEDLLHAFLRRVTTLFLESLSCDDNFVLTIHLGNNDDAGGSGSSVMSPALGGTNPILSSPASSSSDPSPKKVTWMKSLSAKLKKSSDNVNLSQARSKEGSVYRLNVAANIWVKSKLHLLSTPDKGPLLHLYPISKSSAMTAIPCREIDSVGLHEMNCEYGQIFFVRYLSVELMLASPEGAEWVHELQDAVAAAAQFAMHTNEPSFDPPVAAGLPTPPPLSPPPLAQQSAISSSQPASMPGAPRASSSSATATAHGSRSSSTCNSSRTSPTITRRENSGAHADNGSTAQENEYDVIPATRRPNFITKGSNSALPPSSSAGEDQTHPTCMAKPDAVPHSQKTPSNANSGNADMEKRTPSQAYEDVEVNLTTPGSVRPIFLLNLHGGSEQSRERVAPTDDEGEGKLKYANLDLSTRDEHTASDGVALSEASLPSAKVAYSSIMSPASAGANLSGAQVDSSHKMTPSNSVPPASSPTPQPKIEVYAQVHKTRPTESTPITIDSQSRSLLPASTTKVVIPSLSSTIIYGNSSPPPSSSATPLPSSLRPVDAISSAPPPPSAPRPLPPLPVRSHSVGGGAGGDNALLAAAAAVPPASFTVSSADSSNPFFAVSSPTAVLSTSSVSSSASGPTAVPMSRVAGDHSGTIIRSVSNEGSGTRSSVFTPSRQPVPLEAAGGKPSNGRGSLSEDDVEAQLQAQPWYHGDIGTGEACRLLESAGSGAFLVRKSGTQRGQYVLCVNWMGAPSMLRIAMQPEGRCILCGMRFVNIAALVVFFSRRPLPTTPEQAGQVVTLSRPISSTRGRSHNDNSEDDSIA